jgi:hypothetical protein
MVPGSAIGRSGLLMAFSTWMVIHEFVIIAADIAEKRKKKETNKGKTPSSEYYWERFVASLLFVTKRL